MIDIRWDSEIAYSDDPLLIQEKSIEVQEKACFTACWNVDIRVSANCLTLLVDDHVTHDMAIGYVQWMRSCGWNVYAVSAPTVHVVPGTSNWYGDLIPNREVNLGVRTHLRLF